MIVFTAAIQIGDEASWILKLGNRVPKVNIIACIFMGTLIVEKQADWIEPQLNAGNRAGESKEVASIRN